jgi:2-polyprenyl-3-methyl-5-hydroxy-6-metoxy-1,4-benzoquinol methylase
MKFFDIFKLFFYKLKIEILDKNVEVTKREQELDRLLLVNNLEFENQFRGSRDLILERQKPYVGYFKNCRNVLDIGCGRGEFLEILRQNEISCLGIDSDGDMVKECRKKKLNVKPIDLFDYLLECKDNYHDGIVSFQVVEHLTSHRVQNFVKLCFHKVKKDKYVIFETVNPLCLQALANFWADLTHEKPLVPSTLQHVFREYGFSKADIVGRTPVFPNVPDFVVNPKDLAVYGDYAIVAQK